MHKILAQTTINLLLQSPMTIQQALTEANQALQPITDEARLEAEMLVAFVLTVNKPSLVALDATTISKDQSRMLGEFIKRRLNHEPLAYIIGRKEFYKQAFYVDPAVLIPRPETELLIDQVIAWTKQHAPQTPTIADIGTGSGCIAISLAEHLPKASVIAADISEDALHVARKNAESHNVVIDFRLGSLLAPIPDPVDIIVANLPYIPTDRISTLDKSVKDWEPIQALDGGMDGFDRYRQLLIQISGRTELPKLFVFEIDETHTALAKTEIADIFPKAQLYIHKDLAGLDRFIALLFSKN